jgi:hypothetical protein
MGTILGRGKEVTPAAGTGFSLVAILEIIQSGFDLESVALPQDVETWLMRIIAFLLISLAPLAVSWARNWMGIRTRREG